MKFATIALGLSLVQAQNYILVPEEQEYENLVLITEDQLQDLMNVEQVGQKVQGGL